MKPIKLVAMTHRFGSVVDTNEEAEQRYNLEPGFILKRTGTVQRHRWENFLLGESLPIIAWQQGSKLLDKLGWGVGHIDAVFGSSNLLEVPSQAHQFAFAAGMQNRLVVPSGYGCGGFLAAVQHMHLWLQNQRAGARAFLVLTDAPTSMVNEYRTGILFSDALHVSIWSNDPNDEGFVVEEPVLAMAEGDPRSLCLVDGCWHMDGSAIAKFALSVPKRVFEWMSIQDVGRFDMVPHQPNAKLLESFESRYNTPFYSKVVRQHGNPTCSGMMIALEYFMEENQSTRPILAIGFGDSLSYGAMIVRRE